MGGVKFDRDKWLDRTTYCDNTAAMSKQAEEAYSFDRAHWNIMSTNMECAFSLEQEEVIPKLNWIDDAFYGKYTGPVIVCGAGPSLVENIEHVKEKYLEGTPVIATDRALRFLKKSGIKPMLTVSVDSKDSVYSFYKDCLEAGDNVAISIVCDYSLHMIPQFVDGVNMFAFGNIQAFSPFWGLAYENHGRRIACVRPGFIVTFTACDIAVWCGFDKIVTVGNELSFSCDNANEIRFAAAGGHTIYPLKNGRLTIMPFFRAAHQFAQFKQWHPGLGFFDASGCGIAVGWTHIGFNSSGETPTPLLIPGHSDYCEIKVPGGKLVMN